MGTADLPGPEESHKFIRFHHGTDLACANDILQNGVDQQRAAAWNGSGEFWATTDHNRAEWFARSHPSSPPAACFEFDLPEPVFQTVLQMNPPGARHHAPSDYEFFPPSYALLNQYMVNRQVVLVP
jgi:hypothetical protein